eukprot:6205086-Pleurochrysis_carterae.AAC.7
MNARAGLNARVAACNASLFDRVCYTLPGFVLRMRGQTYHLIHKRRADPDLQAHGGPRSDRLNPCGGAVERCATCAHARAYPLAGAAHASAGVDSSVRSRVRALP